MNKRLRDFLGNEIKVGGKLVYAYRQGSCLELKTMTVNGTSEGVVTGYAPGGRRIRIKNLQTAIFVPEATDPADERATELCFEGETHKFV